jgi:hypothetical protein
VSGCICGISGMCILLPGRLAITLRSPGCACSACTPTCPTPLPRPLLLPPAAVCCHWQDAAAAAGDTASDPPGWRDLTVSQYRVIKGEGQLDITYALSSSSSSSGGGALTPGSGGGGLEAALPPPSSVLRSMQLSHDPGCTTPAPSGGHHISNEPLSEMSACIAAARRLPRALLQAVVRRGWRPGEYPPSIQALAASSPDEALPQFYCDPQVGGGVVGGGEQEGQQQLWYHPSAPEN